MFKATFDRNPVCTSRLEAMLMSSRALRARVFSDCSARMIDLFVLIEEMALCQVDRRLAAILLAHRDDRGRLALSGDWLSIETGLPREIVLQHLSEFSDHGWITLTPAGLHIEDIAALERLADVPHLPRTG